jgi:hypothetical protein
MWNVRETPSFYESDVRPKPLAEYIFCHPEIVWNIRDVPPLPVNLSALPDILEELPEASSFWWNKALFGFGDAVCVPVVSWIARNYLNPILEDMLANAGGLPTKKIWAY